MHIYKAIDYGYIMHPSYKLTYKAELLYPKKFQIIAL